MGKAYVYTEFGGPEAEALIDRPAPEPGEGQLLIAVRAAGVNPVDWKLRDGYVRPGAAPAELPAVFGSEAAGIVERVGPGVEGFGVGDAVFGSTLGGGYAEQTLLPVSVAAHKPEALSFADAAALPVAAATAYDGVQQLGLPAGATLLVTGAGGGVGVAAVQIARASGLRVIGVASDGKKDLVTSFGGVHVASGSGFADRVRAVAPDGVDAVFDLVGGDVLEEAASLLDDRTALISAGDRERVVNLGGAPVARARTAAVLEEVAALVVDGSLRPHVTATFPLERAGEALRTVEEGHASGKVVIEVGA
ncbi:NADP-dependent oxidoreductase [Streptomyces sp. TS71-3]|uniref:NADP-dependent oxidoreductase n=1 Tax=Streptomyces sp. TS71-3 TaxID=2733862 RepID=UPI001B1729F1|nr:NADP-dependent oxidoreductase [Streptomyces sp. TS71-3]GHJ42348.1 NADPH:quinone reductase [Streptomyces sp. TS71-3]